MLLWISLASCTFPVLDCTSDAECVEAFGSNEWTCQPNGRCLGPDDTGAEDPIIPLLTINEVLYDPSNEDPKKVGDPLPGDANGDGKYALDDDEFVELVNVSGGVVDITGYALWDDEAWELGEPRHEFPPNTLLQPGGAIVVFGGGTPTGTFGDATVQLATGGQLRLNNIGDTLRVTRAEDDRVTLTFEIEPRSDNPNESYTRNPDITGVFQQHGDSTPLLFSPGTRVDGTPFR